LRIQLKILIICLILFSPVIVLAQGDIDLKFEETVLTTYDFQVTLMIRNASDKWDRLGSSNLPFYYNYNGINDPTLVTAHNFSGGPYSEMSLVNNGSWASINILFDGGDGQGTLVDSSWKNVATIHFNIIDPDQTSQIRPRTDGAYAAFDDDEQTFLTLNSYSGLDVPLKYSDVQENDRPAPASFKLCSPFPNPFNMEININYELPKRSSVAVRIISITGKVVKSFSYNNQAPGYYTIKWDGKSNTGNDSPSGLYIILFRSKNFTESKKITLIK